MNWKDRLKRQWDDNPLMVITVAAFAATAASKLIGSVTAAQNSRTYRMEINRRVANK